MARSLKIKDVDNEIDDTAQPEKSEYTINWRNLIFLPFNAHWQFVINLSIVVNAVLMIFAAAYSSDKYFETITNQIYYVMESLYAIDSILCIMHRNMATYRRIREHEPRFVILIFIDVCTLLPIYEVYTLLSYTSRIKEDATSLRNHTRVINVIRLYRVFWYFRELSYRAGLNQILIIGSEHILKTTMITDLLGAVWYLLGCWKCHHTDWTQYLHNHIFNPKEWTNWFMLCYVTMGNLYQHNYKGEIRGVVPIERAMVLFAMLSGYIEHIMIFFGRLTACLTKMFRRQYMFAKRLNHIIDLLNEWEVTKEIKDKTMEYYNTLWNKRKGIKDMPQVFNLLPLPLQKEVTLDIFWEAIRHSHLFANMDMPFKRALSLEMKAEFFLAGDYVFRLGQTKNKMVYIVSGILQILTAEDEESPIISFSSGTIIGEISTIIATTSRANVRCATYSEVQTLSLEGLSRALLKFPEKRKKLKEYLSQKIYDAKEMLGNILDNETMSSDEHEENTVRWIKERWRQLFQLQGSRKSCTEAHLVRRDDHHLHTSENLDLLVLSEEVELKIQAICLNSECPFVMEPTSSFRRFCDYLILAAVLLQSAILPYNISFNREFSQIVFSMTILLDLVYFFDIYLQISTAVKRRMHSINTTERIILYKMKQISFLIDLVATIPVDYIGIMLKATPHTVVLLKINRLFKIYKLINLIQEKESNLLINSLHIRLIKHACVYILATYWLTCIIYSMACFNKECFEYSWYNYNKKLAHQAGLLVDVNRYDFTDALYYTISSLFLTAMSNTVEYVLHEVIVIHLVMNIGYYLFSFCFAELCATFLVRQQDKLKYKEYIRASQMYLVRNKIPAHLKQQVSEIRQFHWFYSQNTVVFGRRSILRDAPDYLKEKIIQKRIIDGLQLAPFFQECNEEFLKSVALRATLKVLPPGAVLCTANNKPSWMHIITKGHCVQRSVMAGDVEMDHCTTLNAGDSFPVIEMLHEVLVLTDVKTLTTVEIISIRYLDLLDIFQGYRDIHNEIKEVLDEHLSAYEAALLRKRGRLPDMIPAEKSLGQGEMFKYEIYDEEETSPEKEAFMKPFRKLGMTTE